MAVVTKLMNSVDEIITDTYDWKNEAEKSRDAEYKAAVSIQSWFRGLKTRAYLDHLNESATAIQRLWRGWLGRKYYRILLRNSLDILRLNRYNQMATIVQKHWRGYYTRKYVFNYYSRKRYLEGLQIKNEIVLAELQSYKEHLEAVGKQEKEKKQIEELDHWARKNHHLLSTSVSSGIYNSPYLPRPMPEEFFLRHAKPLDHHSSLPSLNKYDPAYQSYLLPKSQVLPPVPTKPQGPFRDPDDVQNQRYKPFDPSLRVETDFYSVEKVRGSLKEAEWLERINDNYFQPFKRRSVPYEPLLHTTSKYCHLKYGTKFFREEFLDKHISGHAFQTVVPPIPIFDKMNNTYSQGQV